MNSRNCTETVTKYMGKWARAAGADRAYLEIGEKTVHECINERVRLLKQRRLNKRKKQVLRNKVHYSNPPRCTCVLTINNLNLLIFKYTL